MIQDFLVEIENFEIQRKLGEGAYGTVYLVIDKETGEKFAAKVSKNECLEISDQKKFFLELATFFKINNPSVLSLKGFNMTNFLKEHYPTILTQYMPNGSLDRILFSDHEISGSQKYIFLLGIASGMKYLHSCSIIHRDLKPGNILLDLNYYPHIGDFGESKISNLSVSSITMETYKGTPSYMAPEVFKDDVYTYKADVYSYSIIAYEILTQKKAFQGYKQPFALQSDICDGKRPDLALIKDVPLQQFLTQCWSQDPSKRPTFDEIYSKLKSERYIEMIASTQSEVLNYIQLIEEFSETKLENTNENIKNEYGVLQTSSKKSITEKEDKIEQDYNKKSEDDLDWVSFKKSTIYDNNCSCESQTVIDFWHIFENEWDNSMRVLFVNFITGEKTVSKFLLANLHMKVKLIPEKDYLLPLPHSSSNWIDLPDYKNREILKNRLEMCLGCLKNKTD